MARITLTREIANDFGEYVAGKRMRAAGRTRWNRDDYNAACIESARVALELGGCEAMAAREVLSRSGREGKRIVREFDARQH